MKKLLFTFAFALISVFSFAQIEGKWKTIDDETKEAKSIVEVFKKADGKYYAKIVQLLQKPENANCVKCSDDRKNKPLVGLEIIRGLKQDGQEFNSGTITDPKSGKSYKCIVKREGNKLNLRGYVGIPTIGRTQIWEKVN